MCESVCVCVRVCVSESEREGGGYYSTALWSVILDLFCVKFIHLPAPADRYS